MASSAFGRSTFLMRTSEKLIIVMMNIVMRKITLIRGTIFTESEDQAFLLYVRIKNIRGF
jgi:hypothetical protein